MEKFIDTHAHYHHKKFKNRDELLKEMQSEVKYIINLGTDVISNFYTISLINKYDYVYGMVGFFPSDVYLLDKELCDDSEDNLKEFKKQLTHKKIVGIGEIGIDYHWNSVGARGLEITGEKAREYQHKWFKYQIDLAKELNLPVSMHSRDAEKDTLDIFSNYDNINGVMHCFSYGMKSAEEYLKKGLYFGIGGTSTYPNNKELREVIEYLPLNRILLETDAPYLSPQKVRGTMNDSRNIKYVIENIAEIKNVDIDEVIDVTNKNAIKLFGLE